MHYKNMTLDSAEFRTDAHKCDSSIALLQMYAQLKQTKTIA